MKTVYLFLATGFEEIEALTIVDMLRRAEIDLQPFPYREIFKLKELME